MFSKCKNDKNNTPKITPKITDTKNTDKKHLIIEPIPYPIGESERARDIEPGEPQHGQNKMVIVLI
jgi:hypothetical protein